MNTNVIKRFFWVTLYLAIIVAFMNVLSNQLEEKGSEIKYEHFFDEELCPEVFFMGTSHVLNAVFPDMLWTDYGITSYNLGNSGELCPTTREVLLNALEYHQPEVVVVDLFAVSLEDTYYNKSFSHTSLDAFPLTWTKIRSIMELFDDWETRAEFINNFCLYHTRWNEIFSIERNENSNIGGGEFHTGFNMEGGDLISSSKEAGSEVTDGILAILEMKSICDERGIEFVCINLPYSGFYEREAPTNYALQLLEEQGVDCIDFRSSNTPLLLDSKLDFFDTQHCNPLGGTKITSYLGGYLKEHYNVGNYVNDERISGYWDQYVNQCAIIREDLFKEQIALENWNTALMLAKANQYLCEISISPNGFEAGEDTEVFLAILEDMDLVYEPSSTLTEGVRLVVRDKSGKLIGEYEFYGK